MDNAVTVQCPTCKAKPGAYCRKLTRAGWAWTEAHPARVTRATHVAEKVAARMAAGGKR